jgi:hypothetical protein
MLRFWWIGLAGVAAALGVLVLMLYHVKRIWPPLLVAKAIPSYLATTELLVDSPTGPYLRTAVSRQPTTKVSGSRSSSQQPPLTVTTNDAVAATKPLVDAANLFPIFVESDEVARIRFERYGDIPGAVQAKALYAAQGANRYRPSVLPVMQIAAVSRKPRNAIRLAEATAKAFQIWLATRQRNAHVPPAQRIIVRQLHAPQTAASLGGTHYGLPALVALALLGGFLGLAVVADHVFPRRPRVLAEAATPTEPDEASQRSIPVASRLHSN